MPKRAYDPTQKVGLAWFDRKQWKRLTETVKDRNELPNTYEQWEQSALNAVRVMEHQGQIVERVHVEVESLVSWCEEKGLPVSVKTLPDYVMKLMRGRHRRAVAFGHGRSEHDTTASALEILNERFAKGEISKEEFDEKRTILMRRS